VQGLSELKGYLLDVFAVGVLELGLALDNPWLGSEVVASHGTLVVVTFEHVGYCVN